MNFFRKLNSGFMGLYMKQEVLDREVKKHRYTYSAQEISMLSAQPLN